MPLALSPNVKHKVILKSDLHKTTKERPVFVYRFLTGHEWEQVASISDQLADLKSDKNASGKDAIDIVYAAACTGLVGWKNMIVPNTKKIIPFKPGPEQLKKVVGFIEARELIERILTEQKPTGKDLKNSG